MFLDQEHIERLSQGAQVLGGGGGGRPNMAQAGGKNAAGIDAAISEVKSILESQM